MSKRSNHAGVYSISLCALLLSMMLIVGYVESMIPLNVGIPGIKLGMSNSVLIFAVYMLDIPTAFMLMSLKVLLSGILFAGPTTMMYGFAGGVLSLLCMALLSRIKADYPDFIGTAHTEGTKPLTPPAGGGKTYTREQLKGLSAEEINANWAAVQAALKGE